MEVLTSTIVTYLPNLLTPRNVPFDAIEGSGR